MKKDDLTRRLITALLFIPALIIIALEGRIYFLLLIELGIGIGTFEFYTILEARGLKPYKSLGIAAALLLGCNSYFHSHIFTFLTITVLVVALSVSELFRRQLDQAIFHITSTVYGVMYVGWLMSHLILLREMPKVTSHPAYHLGASYALLPFVLTWPCDSAAFFLGKRFGMHKLLERVSPGKTWEGAIAGGLTAVGAAFIYQKWFHASYLSNFDCIALGVLIGLAAPVGDFVESLIKRDANLKDSSATIPGHGGVLDRFDSILITAPIVYYYLRFFAAR
jgi:phosphatidate cytidylyltransferase